MAHIVPSIEFVSGVKYGMQNGQSLTQSLERQLGRSKDRFHWEMARWFAAYKSGHRYHREFPSIYQQSLVSILEEGLRGAPIVHALDELEAEMLFEFETQWKAYVERLPTILSIPLLLLFFPAYIVLLFGPLINSFLAGVGQ